jgi:lactoylglutathione lyase
MKIHHVAVWTPDLERSKSFYEKYFGCVSSALYINEKKRFTSYFLDFDGHAKIELMHRPDIPINKNNAIDQYQGFIHIAISVGSKEKVDELYALFLEQGVQIASEPRLTGDGYYELTIMDPDGNRIEVTI